MITDAALRAHLLTALHGLRNSNTGWVPVSDMNFGGLEPVAATCIRTICEQLDQAGLIAFKPTPGEIDEGFIGVAKISGHGCDVAEGLTASSIALDFPLKRKAAPATAPRQHGDGDTLEEPSLHAPDADNTPEIFVLKPTLWGMSIDLKEIYRRALGRWTRRNA